MPSKKPKKKPKKDLLAEAEEAFSERIIWSGTSYGAIDPPDSQERIRTLRDTVELLIRYLKQQQKEDNKI